MTTAINGNIEGENMTDIYRGADVEVSRELYAEIKKEAETAISELVSESKIKAGEIMVVGCSSSEILGSKIGKGSSYNAAVAAFEGIYPKLNECKVYLAAQCCEHLNRAIVIEREAAEKYGFEIVAVVPKPKAGGSFATVSYERMKDPVMVEYVTAHAGIDIGGTLIGMHLKRVAVPVRLSVSKIGEANIICARTRPKYIGGERAEYI